MQAPSRPIEATAAGAVNLESVARDFDRALRVENKSPNTRQTYGSAIAMFVDFLRERGMPGTADGFQREHVEEFLLSLVALGMKPATVSNRYRALRTFCRWVVAEGERRDDPMERMKPPRIPEYEPAVLTIDELRRLIETTERDEKRDRATASEKLASRRDAALIRLFVDSGARRKEIADLSPGDLDFTSPAAEGGALVKLFGKGGRERTVRVGAKTAQSLRRYIRLRDSSAGKSLPWLWVNIRGQRLTDSGIFQAIRERGIAAGLPTLYPHTFRHTAAHFWLMDAGTEIDLQTRAGWASGAMVARYASTTRAERAHAAHQRHGLGDKL